MAQPGRPRREWLEPAPIEIPNALSAALGGHILVAQYLARKGLTTVAAAERFLSADKYAPASPAELPDIEPALERLERAIDERERILIWGDFDVDGQTSTALLFSALQGSGARVAHHVPNRFSEGHGIHLPTLQRRLDEGVDLLLTCDTGVSAHDAIETAASRGVDAIITDHHALPQALPAAVAVINPRRLPAGHPLRELPGVGVAHKLMEALIGSDACEPLLDLVALGIVADVALQVDDTRYLLQRGLEKLRENQRPGLRAILERAEVPAAALNEGHIGFDIAPRLNALGRLADANPAVELLTTSDWARARILANTLESCNARRKFLSNQVYESALAQIESQPWLLDYAALVLSNEEWHSGVIGIVASRLVEEFGLPVALIAAPDETGRGSARSVEGVDITTALGMTAPILTRYGGHSMAAGFSLPAADIYQFRRALSRALRELAGGAPASPALAIDGYLELVDLSLDLTADLERLAPFGKGNPPLTLATRNLGVASRKGLGRRGEHLQVEVEDEAGGRQRVIWWRGAGADLPSGRFDLAYTLRASSYRGRRETLVEWLDFRPIDSAPIDLAEAEPIYELHDYRQEPASLDLLARARNQYPAATIWSEGAKLAGAADRLGLEASETLIVCSAPPSAEIWSAALATVNPSRLILFGERARREKAKDFLERLASLVKYAVNQKGGVLSLDALAAAMGERERSVQVGLQVLRALGKLDYQVGASGECRLEWADKAPSDQLEALQKRLSLLLRETRAYRNYWLTMKIQDEAHDI
ncbi:MAG: single-stranded-DNA-specific exonuclease RecJ [Chloroflexi bacterium]|nr:single-stranded-DNA-specific exonuclease RecJ [Chloroflexota bacterium]